MHCLSSCSLARSHPPFSSPPSLDRLSAPPPYPASLHSAPPHSAPPHSPSSHSPRLRAPRPPFLPLPPQYTPPTTLHAIYTHLHPFPRRPRRRFVPHICRPFLLLRLLMPSLSCSASRTLRFVRSVTPPRPHTLLFAHPPRPRTLIFTYAPLRTLRHTHFAPAHAPLRTPSTPAHAPLVRRATFYYPTRARLALAHPAPPRLANSGSGARGASTSRSGSRGRTWAAILPPTAWRLCRATRT